MQRDRQSPCQAGWLSIDGWDENIVKLWKWQRKGTLFYSLRILWDCVTPEMEIVSGNINYFYTEIFPVRLSQISCWWQVLSYSCTWQRRVQCDKKPIKPEWCKYPSEKIQNSHRWNPWYRWCFRVWVTAVSSSPARFSVSEREKSVTSSRTRNNGKRNEGLNHTYSTWISEAE